MDLRDPKTKTELNISFRIAWWDQDTPQCILQYQVCHFPTYPNMTPHETPPTWWTNSVLIQALKQISRDAIVEAVSRFNPRHYGTSWNRWFLDLHGLHGSSLAQEKSHLGGHKCILEGGRMYIVYIKFYLIHHVSIRKHLNFHAKYCHLKKQRSPSPSTTTHGIPKRSRK